MDDLDEIRRRLRITNLEARIELREIEAEALVREIRSPLTSAARRAEAIERRTALLTERSAIKTELDEMRLWFPVMARH